MSIFKCKMCGGTLEINNNESVATCEYCGTQQTLPKLDDERRVNLYDRANHFRRNNEFDKAMGIYEQILNEDNTDAEAYWSLVLCRYGIEYVEDPATHKRVPTVNRAQFTSVYMDEDYKSALQYADGYQKQIYEEEAKAIDDIQKGILEISAKEKPFDVFICYKETDNNGRRTPDSVLANDLYHQLTQEGFKVFFARITLEDKLGSAYEPYIFAALNSAKVMVALGTKPEYFNAVWVKNEWSRYLSLVKTSGGKKMLIPAYKDMDPYELPDEFSHLQAQDMSKLGFMQDLIRGIKKLARNDEPKATVVKETVIAGGNANTAPLLKRAFMFLEDRDWNSANEYCERVLDFDPECAEAYLGELMAELKVSTQEKLADCAESFDIRSNYQKALRFADDELKKTLIDYAEAARKNIILAQAKANMSGEQITNYESSIALLKSISGWKDAEDQVLICQNKIKEIEEQIEKKRLERERLAEEERKRDERRIRRNKLIAIIVASIVCLGAVFIIVLNTVIVPAQRKNNFIATYGQEAYDMFGIVEEGTYITFGAYEQDNDTSNGKEEVEWLVLEVKDGKALVISKYALDCKQYNTSYIDVTWEICTLRKWLNNDFLNTAFSEEEKAFIPTVTVPADENIYTYYDTNPGNATQDKVFLLSVIEADNYFSSDSARACNPTTYAETQGLYVYEYMDGNCEWWLRSPGDTQSSASYIDYDGDIIGYGGLLSTRKIAVRPALWIDLSPDKSNELSAEQEQIPEKAISINQDYFADIGSSFGEMKHKYGQAQKVGYYNGGMIFSFENGPDAFFSDAEGNSCYEIPKDDDVCFAILLATGSVFKGMGEHEKISDIEKDTGIDMEYYEDGSYGFVYDVYRIHISNGTPDEDKSVLPDKRIVLIKLNYEG